MAQKMREKGGNWNWDLTRSSNPSTPTLVTIRKISVLLFTILVFYKSIARGFHVSMWAKLFAVFEDLVALSSRPEWRPGWARQCLLWLAGMGRTENRVIGNRLRLRRYWQQSKEAPIDRSDARPVSVDIDEKWFSEIISWQKSLTLTLTSPIGWLHKSFDRVASWRALSASTPHASDNPSTKGIMSSKRRATGALPIAVTIVSKEVIAL